MTQEDAHTNFDGTDNPVRPGDRIASASSTRRIFVSSTFVDLQQHRNLLHHNLERMRQFPVVMESFGAGGTDATTISKEEVAASDIFVILVAWRYGVVPNGATQSITQQEYELARALGKPIFVFLADPSSESDTSLFPLSTRSPEYREQLTAFRAELSDTGRHTFDTFTSPEDLSAKVVTALARHLLLTSDTGNTGDLKRTVSGPVVFGLPPLPAGFVPRPVSLDALRLALLSDRPRVGIVAATALHGMGGLGKTVLARAAWEDPTIRAVFPDGVLWATVGQHPDIATIVRVQRAWIGVLGGDVNNVTDNPETGRSEIAARLGDRKLLLVLDDIWQADDLKPFVVSNPNCRILITTRFISETASATPVSLGLMSPAECRQTLRQAAPGQQFENATLDAIAERVGRLPLGLTIIAGLLHQQQLTWADILHEMNADHLAHIGLGETRDQNVFEAIDVGVRYLPEVKRRRYRELVIFPRDVPLNTTAVAHLWAHTGGMSSFMAKKLLGEFIARSLIQSDHTLHDLQVDHLRAIVPTEEVRALHSTFCDAYAAAEATSDASPWSFLTEDDDLYGWRFIASHLYHAARTSDLEFLLTDVTYLQGKIVCMGIAATASDLDLLAEAEPVRLVASVIRAGTPILEKHPEELLNQMRGRWGSIASLHHASVRPQPTFVLTTQSLKRVDPALIRVFSGHLSGVNSCAFSPDGQYALSASDDQTLRLWEVATGQETRQFTGHTGAVLGCAFSPDGHWALSASDDLTLRLWEVATGKEVRQFIGHTNTVRSCAFSPDGHLSLSASWDGTLRLWEVATGKEVRQLSPSQFEPTGCAFSSDGRLALSMSCMGLLTLWEVASGQEIRRFVHHLPDPPVFTIRRDISEAASCAFSPNGTLALSAAGTQLWLHELGTGEDVRIFYSGYVGITSCAFSPDGTLALSASDDQTLRLWEIATGKSVRQFTGHTGGITSCAFSSDGRFALSASHDGTMRLWEVATTQRVRQFSHSRYSTWVSRCTFSPDGLLVLSAGGDETLQLSEVATGQQVRKFTIHTPWWEANATSCAFSPNGQLAVAASDDLSLWLWEVATGERIDVLRGHEHAVRDCAFSPDGTLVLSASDDQTLRLWEVATGQETRQFTGHTGAVLGCAFSPDGHWALSASDDLTLRLWEVATGKEVRQFIGHTGTVYDCALSSDSCYALSASADQTLRLWEVATGKEVRLFIGHTDEVRGCAFSPDGFWALSAANDQTLRLWDVATGMQRATWLGEAACRCCAFSPRGDRVVVGDSIGGVHLLIVYGI